MYIDIEHDRLWRTTGEPFSATVFKIVKARLEDPRQIVIDRRPPCAKSQVGFAADRLPFDAYRRFVDLASRAGSNDTAFRSILRDVAPVESLPDDKYCVVKIELPFWVIKLVDESTAARILTEHAKNLLTQQQEEAATAHAA